jgi:hypothetical protein
MCRSEVLSMPAKPFVLVPRCELSAQDVLLLLVMEASEWRENMMPRPTALSTNPFGSAGMPRKLTLAAVGHTAVNHSKEEATYRRQE